MFRPAIEKMSPYVPGEQPSPGQRLVKLNTNENPYPPSPKVRRAIRSMFEEGSLRLYPSPHAEDFVGAAARVYRVPIKMTIAGNGSDELLAMLFRATLGRHDRVAYAAPTYSLYDTLAQIQEANVTRVRYGKTFRLPAEALVAARARLTIVCNPNSPSGTFTSVSEIEELAGHLDPRLLVIDEAYVDFAPDNALRLVKKHSNVIVLRSLSKSFSLAGMRLGLGFAHPAIVENLFKVKDSYNLSRVALAVGTAALSDLDWMRKNVARVVKARGTTERKLRTHGFEVPTSSANFVMARLPNRDLAGLARGLRNAGILVRYFNSPELRDSLRISIGTPAEMRALFDALVPLLGASSRNGRKFS